MSADKYHEQKAAQAALSKCRASGTSCMKTREQREGLFQECRTAVMYRSINRFSILSWAGPMETARLSL